MRYFRVQYGFNPDDYFSVDEVEMQKALKAQITGALCVLNEGTIQGERIISIRPDYNRIMGWKRDYKLTGEDYDYIGQKTIEDYERFIADTKLLVQGKPIPQRSPELAAGVKEIAQSKKV